MRTQLGRGYAVFQKSINILHPGFTKRALIIGGFLLIAGINEIWLLVLPLLPIRENGLSQTGNTNNGVKAKYNPKTKKHEIAYKERNEEVEADKAEAAAAKEFADKYKGINN